MINDSQKIIHERYIYSILDCLGDIGGVLEVLFVTIGLLIYPISEHKFLLNAIKKLYLASSSDKSLFVSQAKKRTAP